MKIYVEGVVTEETIFTVEVDASTEEEALEYVSNIDKRDIIKGLDGDGRKIKQYVVHIKHVLKDFDELGAFTEEG